MLKQQQPQNHSGRLSSLGTPAKIFIAALLVLIVVIVSAMLLNRGGGNSQQVVDLMAQSQEIVRVSQLQEQQLQDSNTKGLAATAVTAMRSQQAEFGDILKRSNVKYGEIELAFRTNKDTDARLQTAAQNNNLDDTYTDYLKSSLSTYQSSLEQAFQATQSVSLRQALQSAYESITILLNSPQFKS